MENHFRLYGLHIEEEVAPDIRRVLQKQTQLETETQGAGDTKLMKLCCVQLFHLRNKEDILLIGAGKRSRMDADCSIDVQLLCGNGLGATIRYLQALNTDDAKTALNRIIESHNIGLFDDFSVEEYTRIYEKYYRD